MMYMVSGLIAVRIVTVNLSRPAFDAWVDRYGALAGIDQHSECANVPDITANDLPPSYTELFTVREQKYNNAESQRLMTATDAASSSQSPHSSLPPPPEYVK